MERINSLACDEDKRKKIKKLFMEKKLICDYWDQVNDDDLMDYLDEKLEEERQSSAREGSVNVINSSDLVSALNALSNQIQEDRSALNALAYQMQEDRSALNALSNQMKEDRSALNALSNQIKAVEELIQGKEKSKNGSNLSKTELECFKGVRLLIDQVNFISWEEKFSAVKNIIKKQTETLLITFRSASNGSKEDVVQSNSLALLTDLNTLFSQQFDVFNKTSGIKEISYKTILTNELNQHVANVNGETDEVLFYQAVCVLYFEDKALKEDLKASKYMAQAFSELKGFAEAFQKACGGREAPNFWGIMRNGIDWLFLNRNYSNGYVSYTYTNPIRIAEDPTSQSSSSSSSNNYEENLETVTKFVCNILSDIQVLTSIIKKKSIREDTNEEPKDDEYGGFDDDEDKSKDEDDDFDDRKREREDDDENDLPDTKKQNTSKGGQGNRQTQHYQSSFSGLSAYDMIRRWNYFNSLPLVMRKYAEI